MQVNRKCEERGSPTAQQNLARFLEPARGRRGESLTYLSNHITGCLCGCHSVGVGVGGGGTPSCQCVTYVMSRECVRVCVCCFGSALACWKQTGRQSCPGVVATSRGRPSVWYSVAQWGAYCSDIIGYTLYFERRKWWKELSGVFFWPQTHLKIFSACRIDDYCSERVWVSDLFFLNLIYILPLFKYWVNSSVYGTLL